MHETRTDITHVSELSTTELLKEIVTDARILMTKELDAAKLELRQELVQARRALLLGATAIGAAMAATIGITFMLAFVLERYTIVPLWLSFAIVAAFFLVVGIAALLVARRQAKGVELEPERTIAEARHDARIIRREVRV